SGPLLSRGRECALKFARIVQAQELKLDRQCLRRLLRPSEFELPMRIRRVRDDCYVGETRNDLLEQLETLPGQLGTKDRKPRDICPRPRKAADKTAADQIASAGHDNGDSAGCLLECSGTREPLRHDEIDIEADQLGREAREWIEHPFCPSVLDDYILSLHVTEIAKALPKCLNIKVGRRPRM